MPQRPVQTQGVHHITLNGADRQTSIDFWEGLLGMPFVFEQPNLDDPGTNHLYFDPGDGRLVTIFTNEERPKDASPVNDAIGSVHHLAFAVSRVSYLSAAERLEAAGYPNTGNVDRGFMDSIYFRDPLGHRIELACYKFEPPEGRTHADVLARAHRIRVGAGDKAIAPPHLAEAIEQLTAERFADWPSSDG